MRAITSHTPLRRTFAIASIAFVLIAVCLIWEVTELRVSLQWVDHSDQVINADNDLLRLNVDMESGLRGYLLTRNGDFLEPFRAARSEIEPRFAALSALTADNPAQHKQVAIIHVAYLNWVSVALQGDERLPSQLQPKAKMDLIRAQHSIFLNAETNLRKRRIETAVSGAALVNILLGLVVLLGGACVVLGFQKSIWLSEDESLTLDALNKEPLDREIGLESLKPKRAKSLLLWLRSALITTGIPVVATVLSLPMRPIHSHIIFVAAVCLITWIEDIWHALVAVGLSILLIDYFLIPPYDSFSLQPLDVLGMVIFAVVQLCISWAIDNRTRLQVAQRNSERKFRGLIEASPQMTWITRADGWNIYFSKQWMVYTGLTLEESLGHGWSKPFHPDDQKRAWDAWQRAATKPGTKYEIECRLRQADGVYRWWLIVGARQLRPDGTIDHWFGTCTDIHDRIVAQEASSQTRVRLQEAANLLDLSHDAIIVRSFNGEITFWNNGAEQLYGFSKSSATGKDAHALLRTVFPKPLAEINAQLLRDRRWVGELEHTTENGCTVLVSSRWVLQAPSGSSAALVMEINNEITQLRLTEKELQRSDEKLRLLISGVKDHAIFMLDPKGLVTTWDEGARIVKGYLAEEIIGRNFSTFYTAEDIASGLPARQLELAAKHGRLETEALRVRKDGTTFIANVVLTALKDEQGTLRGFGKVTRDVTARKRAEVETAVLLRTIHQHSIVSITDLAGRIVEVNDSFCAISGFSREELLGKTHQIVNSGIHSLEFWADMWSHICNGESWRGEICNRSKDGSLYWLDSIIAPFLGEDGLTTKFISIRTDITLAKLSEGKLRQATEKAEHLAVHDFLTGLPNRSLLNDRIEQGIARQQRRKGLIALLFIDLDGFKHVNDSLGHSTGDRLLQSVAKRLEKCLRAPDTVSRQGGDEFVVLLHDVKEAESVAIVAKRILETVENIHSVDQHDLHITASIGVSICPDDGLTAELLIKNADTAMYQAKGDGRNRYRFFKPEMNARAVERQSVAEDLRRALKQREFTLHYQPIFNLKSEAISGVEALIRWNHPTTGLIPPARFIPIAEDSGMILPIGAWVLREACSQAKAWIDAGLPAIRMTVNVSAIQFQHEGFVESLFAILEETGMNPGYLELEVTESALMKHADLAAPVLQTLRNRGIRVSVDDFGTGYSSLNYLKKFPLDALKIDRSFVTEITRGSDDASLVTAIISMARSLRLQVIAEGVETWEELKFIKAEGCDEAQGYLFSRPIPAGQLALLLESQLTLI